MLVISLCYTATKSCHNLLLHTLQTRHKFVFACLDLYVKRAHASMSARVRKSADDTLTLLVYCKMWVNLAPQSTLKWRISAGKKMLRCIVRYAYIIHSIHTGWLGKKEIPPRNTLPESRVVDADVKLLQVVLSRRCCVSRRRLRRYG